MKNHSYLNFRENLEKLLNGKTYEELALYLDVSSSALKSWINGNRSPALKSIDKLANRIGCYSANLLRTDSNIENKGIHTNDSHHAFVKNLNIIFLKNQCFSIPQKLNLLNNIVTDFALQSYLRKKNYKLPTLSKLDLIADELSVNAYSLLSEEIG